jgi:phage-related baseplate assembly protein
MTAFTQVDLSKLPSPQVIQQLDYEAELETMKGMVRAAAPDLARVLDLESEPAVKLLEIAAYYVLLVRGEINDGARAVMLAHATSTDLDAIAANYNVARLLLDAGDPDAIPPVPPTYESDAELRRRVQLSFEGFSTAGPVGAYVFHGLGADPDVLDIAVESPTPGDVTVTVLSRQGDGTAPAGLIAAVDAVLSDDDVRPLTDNVTVQSATILTYAVEATLTLYPGPDASVVEAAAEAAVQDYIDAQHRLGRDVTRSGLFAALHQPGVQNVDLVSPAADLVVGEAEASHCTGITITVGGTDV